jgi:hypothetical protein
MKYLRKIKMSNKLMTSLCLMFLVLASCTKPSDVLNYDQKRITDKMLEQDANEGGFQLPGMQNCIIDAITTWRYEMQCNLCCDNWGGYVSLPSNFMDNKNTGTYAMVDSWNTQVWTMPSTGVLDQWVQIKKSGFDVKYPDLYAMALIFKVWAGHRLVDNFGPMPYTLYGTGVDVKFDSEKESYDQFFTELRTAVASLTAAETDDPAADQIRYKKFDRSRYAGDYAKWIRVANTLRLRLAMRISLVDPVKAKTEAEAAIADGGVIEPGMASVEVTTGARHPLVTITEDWQESRLNAAVESFLGGYNDPRLPVYGKPSAYQDSIKGIRSGAIMSGAVFGFSQLNFNNNPWMKLMDVAESSFLRAEGVLRGWDMGGKTAQEYYEQGIRASFAAQKVSGVEAYINDDTSVPRTYVDPVEPRNNAAPLTSITIKWDEGATFEQKLERIITQKWIAMYPEGGEAWAEFRRTGYPRLWPVAENNSEWIPDGEFIKRMAYPNVITNSSATAVAKAITDYLNGHDSTFEPLWWDVN